MQSRLFELIGGHPALDLVNTLNDRFGAQGPHELLQSYADLLWFARQSQLLSAQQAGLLIGAVQEGAAAWVLQSARELREALAAALYGAVEGRAPAAALIRSLEQHFLAAGRHRQLQWLPLSTPAAEPWGANWVWGRFESDVEFPVWARARAASDLVTSPALGQVRTCGRETCRRLFLDTSKNHTRRWCAMNTCGNRMKARRFHARRKP
jgi:predicted RNA-binding Zn ribbon-like protein